MSEPTPADQPAKHRLLDPLILGTICGLLSAVVYTAANAFLRSVKDCDPVWVSAVKAVPTVIFMAPWVAVLVWRSHRLYSSWQTLAGLAAAGLVGQLVGNVAFQWSLTRIGIALTVPLTLGGMIVSATILGRIFLYEPVTPRAAVSITILLAAICVLSLGASDAQQSVAKQDATLLQLAAGAGAAILCGLVYSVLNVVIRYAVVRGTPLPTTLLTVSLMGMLSLGLVSWLRIGQAGMMATRPTDLALMLLAGVCNAAAFLALTKSLQLTSVVYVNALNATQATLAAIAGVAIFREAASPWLLLGIFLTVVGLGLMTTTRQRIPATEPP